MTSVEKRHSSGHRKHRKHSDGAHSDTSSGGSFLDETDREVSSLTDRAFRSLCIGDEAVYNDSDLGGGGASSPSVQREKQLAFSQSGPGHGWDTEALKRAAHERLGLTVQQYGEERGTQGGPPRGGAPQTQGDPQWEGYGERTERGVSATFQRSFVDMSQQEDSQGDEQLSLLNGPMELGGSQHRRSRSRVSSLIKAFSSEGHRDGNLREWSTNEASWDKSALMSIQRELSEFSDACHQNFNSGPFSPPGPFSSRDNNFYSSEMATAVAHMDSTSSFVRTSHSAHSAFNTNSPFFIHSEFSPFKLWRDHNRFPFQHGEVTGFMPHSEFPRWYETPMYKELSLGPQPPGPGMYTERGARPQRKPVAPPPPPRSTSTSSVLQKATALEKRSESELTGQYPPWKQIQGSQSTNRLPSQRPSTVSPTGDLSRRVRDTLSSMSKLQQKIAMMTSEQSVTVEMTAKQQQGMLKSYDGLIPLSTVERSVAGSAASSTTPFNISQLLTPVIPAYQDTETLDALSPPSMEHPPVRAESRGATPDIRSSYKSRATSLLFNLKDNRKRVKSTYSPPKFKGPEMADRSKQHFNQNANEPRDTIIDMPDFPDPVIQIPQVLVQEEPGMTDAYSGLNAEYSAREYLAAQMQGEMVPLGGFCGFPQGNYNSNQLINGLNRQEDLSPFTAFKMGQTDKREAQAGNVYGQASSEKLGIYNTLPIATSPLTKHNLSPKPFYSTTDTARSNIDCNSQNRGKTSTEQNTDKSIFTHVDGYEQVKENRYGYNAVSYQDSCRQQAYVSTTSSQAAESLGVDDKPRPAWKGEIAAYMSENDKQAQSSHSTQEQRWNDGTSYHPHKASFHAPYQPLASNNISNQPQQYAVGNESVLKDQSEPSSNQDPGTAKAKYEHHRAQQNEGHETKDNYPMQNYYPYGKMEQEYRKQQTFYSEDTKNTVMQETAQKKRYAPKVEEKEALRLQQNDFKQQHDEQRQLPSSADGRQCNENVLTTTNQIKAENPNAEQIKVDHTETEPPKTLQAEGTGRVQVGQHSPGSSGAELNIEGQPGGERHKAEDMKAERAMGGLAQQVKAEEYTLEHIVQKQAEEGASEGQTGHVTDKLEKAAPDETENKQESKSDNREIQQLDSELAKAQQTQLSGAKQAEDKQADRESIVAQNSYEVKEIEQSEAEQVEISQVTVEQAKVEQIKEELCKIKTEHMEQAKEDKTRGELIEAGQLNTEQTQTEQAKAQLARAELSKIEKMKSESAKSKAKQADTEQVKLEPTKVEHAKIELAKARAELAKIKEKMRGEQKDQVGSVSIEEGNVANKSTPEKFETAEHLKYQQNEDLVVNSSDPVKADRGGDDYEHVREKYGWSNTDDGQKPPLVGDKVVESMNNKESKDETNPERIPIDKIEQEQSLSSTEYDEVRENQYVYSESSKEFKLSSANDLLTDGNRKNNSDTFNDKAKDDQATNDSDKRDSDKRDAHDHNISLSRNSDTAKPLPLERKPGKDTHSTPYRALSYKERAQARQEILTSKIKAHAEKEISAIKEKGLSKNPTKHLVSGQVSHVRQRPPPLETSKGHDKVSNKEQPKVNKVDSSQAEAVMRKESCLLETQTTNKAEGASEAIPEDSAPSLKLFLGQSETTTADDDLQIMGIRVTVRERKPSVSDGQVHKDAHEAAKSKISPETQPLLFKQGIITRKAKDYTNKTPNESSEKHYSQDLDGTLTVEKGQDSAPSEENLYDENNSMTGKENVHISMGTHSGEHSQGEEKLHIDGIAIRIVPRVIEKQEMTENHPAIKIPPSSVGAVNENKPAALPSPGTKTDTSKDEDRAKIVTPGSNELKPIKDSLEARHTSPNERQGTHALRFGDEHNTEITTRENKQVKSGTPEKPMTVEATTHARMDEDYFQLQGSTETNRREANLSSNDANMSNAISQIKEEPGAKESEEIASYRFKVSGNRMAESTAENDITVRSKRMHSEVKAEQASKQSDGPTQRQSKFSARMRTDEDVHVWKQGAESQPHSSVTERQPANNIHSTMNDTMQENVNYKQKPKEKSSTTPEISAIADYARLKVIAAEGNPDTVQDFHPGKREGFFPLIQTRPSRRPVFTTSETQGPSAKEKTLPKEPEISAKVSKEPKAVVFSTVEQEHKRTGMFRLGDKENKPPDVTDAQGANQEGQSIHHPTPASTSASHEEERREKLRQERLAAQRKEEEEVKAKRREAERKAAEERRAKQREEEELRMRRMVDERRAAEIEDAKKAAQREEERRAKERQAIAVRLEEEKRARQREMERRAEEERKEKQREMERKAEEERKAKQREMERKAEEERKAKQREMERKAEEERKAKKREMERKAEEDRKAKQREMERKAEEERKAKKREMERKAEEERKAKQREMERKAEEERKAKQREMERKAEEERKAKKREIEKKAEEERKAKQREMERKAEEERRAKEREAIAAKREQERRDKQRELERREEEERRAKQAVEEMRRNQIEEERRVAQREEERRAKEREVVAARIEEERRERQRQAERRAEEERRAKEIEEQKRAEQREEEEERRAAQIEEERRIKRMEETKAAQIEEERKERERKEEMIAAQRQEEERRRAAQIEEEERKERERKEEIITAQRQEEERRRAAQIEEERKERERKEERMAAQREEERRIKQMEEREASQKEEERKERQRRAAQREEERRRAAQLEEEERRASQEEERRRASQLEEEERRRASQEEEKRRASQEEEKRRASQEEEKRRATQEEERRRASQLEEERKERQRMAARREEGERRRAAQEEERKERQRMVAQIQEERRRAAQIEEEESHAKEQEERRAKESEEEERQATREKERRADQQEEDRRDKRHAAQRTDPLLQYYDINAAEGNGRPPPSPVPSRRRAEPPGVESAEDAVVGSSSSYSRPRATPSPAPSASRSNASSPAPLGAKPTMFKVKDNTLRGASFTRSVKPRFHKNLGEDFRVGSPLDGWRGGSQAAEDEQDRARRTPVQHDGFAGSSRFSQDHSAPLLEQRPYSRRSIALDEDDSRSLVSNVSEDVESFATSAADLAELRGLYDYDRPESACSFSSDVSRSLGKPPSVPAKTEKALRRAKRLTQRRIKKESSKTAVEPPAPEKKALHTDSGVPSAASELAVLSSPHFSAPVSLTHAPTQDPSAPPSRPSSRSFHASPHHSPPVSLPTASPHHSPPVSLPAASPHHSPPVSLPAAPQKVPSVPRSPTLHHAGRPAPVTQYQVEPGYSQNFPVTQRKVLQDPGSGEYYVVDMPVQVKAKTFFDPETGKYVQLNVRQTAQGGSSPQPRRKQQQAQPQQPPRKPYAPSQGYPGYPQQHHHHQQSSLPTHRSSSGMTAASTLPEDSAPARQGQVDGYQENEQGQDLREHNCSPEQNRYMDTACEPGKTRTTAYNTHNAERATRSQPHTNNTAAPRDIITMSELEDFMDDW